MTQRLILMAAGVLGVSSLFAVPAAHAATPTCFGKPATIIGTAGDDGITIPLGHENIVDVVYAGAGRDTIFGREGVGQVGDYFCGGIGYDAIMDGGGSDHVSGGDGNDSIYADSGGADVLQGNGGNDYIQASDAFASGDKASDLLHGNAGSDTLLTGMGSDRAYGDGGSDRVDDGVCGGVPVSLYGGGGNDVISSWVCIGLSEGDSNILRGDVGTDTAWAMPSDSLTGFEEIYYN